MELLNSLVGQINDILWSYVLIILLIGAGIIFTIRTKFVQIRFIKEMIRLIAGDAGNKMEGQQISSFQAFCVSTASRVGVGNIYCWYRNCSSSRWSRCYLLDVDYCYLRFCNWFCGKYFSTNLQSTSY